MGKKSLTGFRICIRTVCFREGLVVVAEEVGVDLEAIDFDNNNLTLYFKNR